MSFHQWILVIAVAGTLAACGSKPSEGPASNTTPAAGKAKTAASGNASAEQVAGEARGDLSCPPRIKTPARAAGAPVDDVVGVRPGMTYEEAANTVMCSHELMVVSAPVTQGFNINTYGQTLRQGFTARLAEPRVEKTSQQIMREMQDDMMARGNNAVRHDLKPGQSKWNVTTMGMPGGETVIAAGREEWFEEGRNPPMASVVEALVKKYGTPSIDQDNPGQHFIRWVFDPLDRLATEGSPIRTQCAGTGAAGGVNLSPDCGLVIEAHLIPMQDNPALVRSLEVGVVNQAKGYELVTTVEQSLDQLEQQRRKKAVEDASKNADAPTL